MQENRSLVWNGEGSARAKAIHREKNGWGVGESKESFIYLKNELYVRLEGMLGLEKGHNSLISIPSFLPMHSGQFLCGWRRASETTATANEAESDRRRR